MRHTQQPKRKLNIARLLLWSQDNDDFMYLRILYHWNMLLIRTKRFWTMWNKKATLAWRKYLSLCLIHFSFDNAHHAPANRNLNRWVPGMTQDFWMYLPCKYRFGELFCIMSISDCLQKIPDSVAIVLTLGWFRWTCSAQISAKPLILSIPWGNSSAWNHICRRTVFGINMSEFLCCAA